MKRLIGSMVLLFITGAISSCHHELDSADDGNKRNHPVSEKPEVKTLTMSFGGDYVTESDEPLHRAADGETFVGINVFRTEKDNQQATEEKYAYGLFIGKDNISIDVITGYTYRFEASILIEEADKVALNNRRYHEPFMLHDGYSTGFDNAWGFETKDMDDQFKYTYTNTSERTREYLCQLSSGIAYVNTGGDLRDGNNDSLDPSKVRYPRVKRFYGTLSGFDPSTTQQIIIPMSYKSFGIRLQLESLPAGSSVRVRDVTVYNGPDPEEEPHLVFPRNLDMSKDQGKTATLEGIYSLSDFTRNSQTFKLRFYWMKGAGDYEYFDHEITVEAGRMKTLKLSIDGEMSETKSGNIIFTNVDNVSLEEDENDEETVSKDF